MQELTSYGIREIRDYLHRNAQAEWCRENGIDTLSLSQLIAKINGLEDPDITHEVFELIIPSIIRKASEQRDSRQLYIDEVNRAFDLDILKFPTRTPFHTRSRFNNFKLRTRHASVREAYTATRNWVSGSGNPILVLGGVPGTGKSHLALAAAAILSRVGRTFIYISEANLWDELHLAMRANVYEDKFNDYCVAPYLFLDDFGASAQSDWRRSELDKLIDARWRHSEWCRTMITSNLNSDEVPVRLSSRLNDRMTGRTVWVRDSDYRLRMGGRI